jgi:putative hydrolase of the HAD superfamily
VNQVDAIVLKAARKLEMRERFAHVNTWVFDLDNTLYPPDSDLWPKIDQRITLYLAHLHGLDGLSARALQKYYYLRYGTTLKGLMDEHAIDAKDFLQFVHDIDRTSLLPNAQLGMALAALPGRKLILTNGSHEHALRTMQRLGIDEHFEDIFDIAAAGLVPKPEPEAFQRFFDKHAVDPASAAMFEDLERNLIVPHARGMVTTLVVAGRGVVDQREAAEQTDGLSGNVDFVTSDLDGFLRGIVATEGPVNVASKPAVTLATDDV